MLVVKKEDCEYLGFKDGFHIIKRFGGNSVESVRRFKMVIDRDHVEYFKEDGSHSPSFATLRRSAKVN